MSVAEIQITQSINDVLKAASECKNKVEEFCQLLLTIQKQKETEIKAEVTKLDSVLLKILEIKKQKELELRNIRKQKEAELKAKAQKMTSVLISILDLKINDAVKDIKNPISFEVIGNLLKRNSLTVKSLIDKCEQFGVISELVSALNVSAFGYSTNNNNLRIKGQIKEFEIPLSKEDFQHLIQTFEKNLSVDELCQNKKLLAYIFRILKTLPSVTLEQHSKVFEALLKSLVCSFREMIDKCANISRFEAPPQVDRFLRNTKLFKNLIDNKLISVLDIKYVLNALSLKMNIATYKQSYDYSFVENCSKSILNNTALMKAILENHLFKDSVDSFKELYSLDQLIIWLNKTSSKGNKVFRDLLEENLISNEDLRHLAQSVKTQNDIQSLNAEIEFMTYLIENKVCTIQELAEIFQKTSPSNHSNLVNLLCNTEFISQLMEKNLITNRTLQGLWNQLSSYALSTALDNGTFSQLPKDQYTKLVKLCVSHANSAEDLRRLSTVNCIKTFCEFDVFQLFIKKCVGRRKNLDAVLESVVSAVNSLLSTNNNFKGVANNDLWCLLKELGIGSLHKLIESPALMNKLLIENFINREFIEHSNKKLGTNFFNAAIDFYKTKNYQTYELLKIFKHTYTFGHLSAEEKKKVYELISDNDIARNRLHLIMNASLEDDFDFDKLMQHLTKVEKKNLLNI